MKNFDVSVEINRNTNWPYIPDHNYRILIIGGKIHSNQSINYQWKRKSRD